MKIAQKIPEEDILGYNRKRKENDFYVSGTWKETTFKKEDILVSGSIWERNKVTKVKKWKLPENIQNLGNEKVVSTIGFNSLYVTEEYEPITQSWLSF